MNSRHTCQEASWVFLHFSLLLIQPYYLMTKTKKWKSLCSYFEYYTKFYSFDLYALFPHHSIHPSCIFILHTVQGVYLFVCLFFVFCFWFFFLGLFLFFFFLKMTWLIIRSFTWNKNTCYLNSISKYWLNRRIKILSISYVVYQVMSPSKPLLFVLSLTLRHKYYLNFTHEMSYKYEEVII